MGTGPHRLAVLPAVSGIDTATPTVGLALALATASGGTVLLLDLDVTEGVLPPGVAIPARFGLARPEPGSILPVAPGVHYLAGARPGDLAGHWSSGCDILLAGCGPGPHGSVLAAALDHADGVVLLTPDTGAGAGSALAALRWLREQGGGSRADGAVVALASASADISEDGLSDTLAQHCRAVRRLPIDACVLPPGVLDPVELSPSARWALLRLAEAALPAAGPPPTVGGPWEGAWAVPPTG